MEDRFLDIREVSKLLNISRETIYRQVRAGRIPGGKVGGQWRFSESVVRSWFAAHSAIRRDSQTSTTGENGSAADGIDQGQRTEL